MTITARLMRLSDGFPVLAVGFLEGLTPKPMAVIAVAKTPMEALQGMFAQAKTLQMVRDAVRYAPLTTIARN